MSEPNEADLVAGGVDIHNWGPTEPNEDDILESLGYVLNPVTGVYEDRS